MSGRYILLVEDDRDDEVLTLRILKKNNILNTVEVYRDGVVALGFLFVRGDYSSRNIIGLAQLILLDLKLLRLDGLEVLKEIRANKAARLLPMVIMMTSNEEKDIVSSYQSGANSYTRKPLDFEQFMESVKQLGLYWLVLNESPVSC